MSDTWSQSKQAVTLSSGLPMRYVELGSGEHTLVLLHGFTSSSRTWALVAPQLATRFRLLIPDLRGHGDSTKPRTGYTIEQMALDTVAFLDALGVYHCALAGVSMGSFVAQQVAATCTARIRNLVLVSSGTVRDASPGLEWLKEQIKQLATPIDEQFLTLWLTNLQPVDADFMAAIQAETAAVPPHVWQEVMVALGSYDPRGLLGKISAETHILFGALDSFFTAAEQQELLTLIPAATLKTYPRNGHNLHWEQPDAIAQDIINFLD